MSDKTMDGQPDRLPSWASRGLAVAVVLFALVFRMMRSKAGLPYVHGWDEPQTASTALRMMQTGDYNPHFFNYGSLTIYLNLIVDVLHYFFLMGQPDDAPWFLRDLQEIKTRFDTGWHWTISHPTFFLWNRYLNSAFGAATVGAAYLLGRELRGVWAGLAAAGVLAGLEYHIRLSSIVGPDVPAAFLVLTAVYLTVLCWRRGRPSFLLWSAAACGLAASVKYNAVTSLAVPVLALCLSYVFGKPWHRHWLAALVPIVAAVTFVMGTPYAVLDLPEFLNDAGYEITHYSVTGHGSDSIEPGLEHLASQGEQITRNLGSVSLLLAIAGLVLMCGSHAGRLVLIFPAVYLLFMTGTRVGYHRNFVVLYPFAAIAIGCALAWIGARLERAAGGRKRLAAWAVPVLVAVAALPGMTSAFASGWRISGREESRTLAIDTLNRLVETDGPAEASVGIARESRVHESDLRRLQARYEVVSHLDLMCDAGSFDYVLTAGRYESNYDKNREKARILNATRPRSTSGGKEPKPLYLDRPSVDPTPFIIKTTIDGESTIACRPPFEPSSMIMTNDQGAGPDGGIRLARGAEVTMPKLRLGPGSYVLGWDAVRPRSPATWTRMEVTITETSPEGDVVLVATEILESSLERTSHAIGWSASVEKEMQFRISLTHDFYSGPPDRAVLLLWPPRLIEVKD